MVISFEEKDRAAIEATGMTVMQFKRALYKSVNAFKKVWETAKEITEIIIDAFGKAFSFLAEDVFPKLKEAIEYITGWYENLPEVERRKLVKCYAKANTPNMKADKNKVYHCRNNC